MIKLYPAKIEDHSTHDRLEVVIMPIATKYGKAVPTSISEVVNPSATIERMLFDFGAGRSELFFVGT